MSTYREPAEIAADIPPAPATVPPSIKLMGAGMVCFFAATCAFGVLIGHLLTCMAVFGILFFITFGICCFQAAANTKE